MQSLGLEKWNEKWSVWRKDVLVKAKGRGGAGGGSCDIFVKFQSDMLYFYNIHMKTFNWRGEIDEIENKLEGAKTVVMLLIVCSAEGTVFIRFNELLNL